MACGGPERISMIKLMQTIDYQDKSIPENIKKALYQIAIDHDLGNNSYLCPDLEDWLDPEYEWEPYMKEAADWIMGLPNFQRNEPVNILMWW